MLLTELMVSLEIQQRFTLYCRTLSARGSDASVEHVGAQKRLVQTQPVAEQVHYNLITLVKRQNVFY